MSKKYSLFFIIFFLVPNLGVYGLTPTQNFIKFSPLELLDNIVFETATLQFSFEKSLPGTFSINQDVGYVFHYNMKRSMLTHNLQNASGVSIETELRRYFFNSKQTHSGEYFALGMLYKYLDAGNAQSIFDSTGTRGTVVHYYYSTEKYSTFRHEVGVHLKIGYQIVNEGSPLFDFSFGIGWRRIMSRSSNAHPLGELDYDFPYNKPFPKGSKAFFSVTAAFRVGFGI